MYHQSIHIWTLELHHYFIITGIVIKRDIKFLSGNYYSCYFWVINIKINKRWYFFYYVEVCKEDENPIKKTKTFGCIVSFGYIKNRLPFFAMSNLYRRLSTHSNRRTSVTIIIIITIIMGRTLCMYVSMTRHT